MTVPEPTDDEFLKLATSTRDIDRDAGLTGLLDRYEEEIADSVIRTAWKAAEVISRDAGLTDEMTNEDRTARIVARVLHLVVCERMVRRLIDNSHFLLKSRGPFSVKECISQMAEVEAAELLNVKLPDARKRFQFVEELKAFNDEYSDKVLSEVVRSCPIPNNPCAARCVLLDARRSQQKGNLSKIARERGVPSGSIHALLDRCRQQAQELSVAET